MKRIVIALVLVFSLLVFGCSTAKNQGEEISSAKKAVVNLGVDDVAKHNTKEDCWMIVNQNVYDVTSFIAIGKHMQIDQYCGKEATTEFMTRSKGPGTPHPDKAMANLDNFYVGTIS